MFGTPSITPAFGNPSSTPVFGTPSATPAFGATSSTPAFGTLSSTPAFGTPSSTPAFGTPSSTPAFGTASTTPAFGASSSTPAFGTTSTTPPFGSLNFGTPSSTSAFGTPSSAPAFGALNFGTPSSTSAFGTPSSAPAFGATPSPSPFGFQQQATPSPSPFGLLGGGGAQITTQMAPVAPLPLSPSDRDIQAIVDAYKEDPGNPRYAFRHLLFSVTEPSQRVKPVAASDIMWAEAMGKLECMDSADRERLWPQLVQGFKDLSHRLKLQDEVLVSDTDRLSMTHSNVKKLQRHFQADTYPWIQRLKQQELAIQRRLLRVIFSLDRLKGHNADLSKRVNTLVSTSRLLASSGGAGGSVYIPSSAKVDERSVTELLEALQQQTEAVAKLGNVLKRDIRDMEIIQSEGTDMAEDNVGRRAQKI
ncbi:Nuclear pore complex protein NUP54 [Zea mays]|uniref:Nuclear pore complex protein NUP54 n=1 Tax=Zea mays TaxID=4577 RepID=A0A3L6E1P7_MAIZE|nr:Nuclear pore complex protein NUP54 [Zea mays]